MEKPTAASAEEWQRARDELLTAEEEPTRDRLGDGVEHAAGWPRHPTYGQPGQRDRSLAARDSR